MTSVLSDAEWSLDAVVIWAATQNAKAVEQTALPLDLAPEPTEIVERLPESEPLPPPPPPLGSPAHTLAVLLRHGATQGEMAKRLAEIAALCRSGGLACKGRRKLSGTDRADIPLGDWNVSAKMRRGGLNSPLAYIKAWVLRMPGGDNWVDLQFPRRDVLRIWPDPSGDDSRDAPRGGGAAPKASRRTVDAILRAFETIPPDAIEHASEKRLASLIEPWFRASGLELPSPRSLQRARALYAKARQTPP